MARSSAPGYVAIRRQTGGALQTNGADMTTTGITVASPPRLFLKALPGLKFSQEVESTRYRETGGGGRDETLELREGVMMDPEFEIFARPVSIGILLAAATGTCVAPALASQALGGGVVSNGLMRRPAAHGTDPFNNTLAASVDAGVDTFELTTAETTIASGAKVAVGWGPTLEVVTLSTVTTASTTVTFVGTELKFPHVAGEPVMKVLAASTLAVADYTTGTTMELASVAGFAISRRLVICHNVGVDAKLGAEFGSTEEFDLDATAFAANVITLAAPLLNAHSIGALVLDVGVAAAAMPADAIHCFEPLTSYDGQNDYYSLARAVSAEIIEKAVDSKLGVLSIAGVAKKPLRTKSSWVTRVGIHQSALLTEDYTGQQIADVPFRFQNGKYFVKVGSSTGMSTKMYEYDFSVNNNVDNAIYTDSIFRDEVLDLARSVELSPKFYFDTGAEYKEIMYGSASPANNTQPSTENPTGYVLMDFRISDTKRMCIWIPAGTWSSWPVEVDPEPKSIQVEPKFAPLKSGSLPVFLAAVYNSYAGKY